MTFEQNIRVKIAQLPLGVERAVLKVVLGEFQTKSSTAKVALTDDDGYTIVKKVIKGNNETLSLLKDEDARKPQLLAENALLATLLPAYLSEADILQYLESGGVTGEIRGAKNEGMGIGLANKHLKTLGKPYEGETVRKVVVSLRS